jgi:hypothetical protein
VDDAIDLLVLHELVEGVEVADVHADKLVVGTTLDIFQVRQVASVGQLIKVDNLILGILVYEKAYYVATYETSTAGDDNISLFHKPIISLSY